MTTTPLTIGYQLQAGDVWHAARLYRRSIWHRKVELVAMVIFIAYAGFALWMHQYDRLLLYSLIAIAFGFGLPFYPWQVVYAFKRNPLAQAEYEVTYDETGVSAKTSEGESTTTWSIYTRLLEDKRTFLLLFGYGTYVVIPKRVFAGNDAEAFRELAQRMIVNKR